MFPLIFFIVACLHSTAVLCTGIPWMPEFVPWPAQQCINHDPQTVGLCSIPNDVLPNYRRFEICRSLSCAVPRNDGTYELRRGIGRPIDGTLCGILKACKQGRCVDIEVDEIPTMTGVRDTFECRPKVAYLPPNQRPLVSGALNAERRPASVPTARLQGVGLKMAKKH